MILIVAVNKKFTFRFEKTIILRCDVNSLWYVPFRFVIRSIPFPEGVTVLFPQRSSTVF